MSEDENTKTPPKTPYKAGVPNDYNHPERTLYKCQTPGSKFPGEKGASSSRTSSRKQFKPGKVSIPTQMEALRRLAEALLITLVDQFAEPVSGRKATAERLQRLIGLAESGAIQHILFYSFDRAFRKNLVAETFFERMRELGIHVWVAGRCVTHAGARDRSLNQQQQIRAEEESNVLSERSNKRGDYALLGNTYRQLEPPGFTFVPVEVEGAEDAKRLAVKAGEKWLFEAVYREVALSGAHLCFKSAIIQQLRELYPQIRHPRDLERLIADPVYMGLNTYGGEAFETPFTPVNRIVSQELFQNANHRVKEDPHNTASLSQLAQETGVPVTLDALLDVALVLCPHCLAPLRRGSLHEHKGLVSPKLECRGHPLNLQALAKLQRDKEGQLTAADLRAFFDAVPSGKQHHVFLVVPGAKQEDARFSKYRCDNCFEVRISQFTVTDHGYRKYLWCNTCSTGRWIPRRPWQTPKGPFKQSMKWVPCKECGGGNWVLRQPWEMAGAKVRQSLAKWVPRFTRARKAKKDKQRGKEHD